MRAAASILFALLATTASALDTVVVEETRTPAERTWFGVVEAVHQATLNAQTAGRVKELPFDVHDYVPEGAVVVRFTDEEPQARLKAAQASLAAAEAQQAQASKDFARIKELYARKLVARAELDAATARHDTTEANMRAAQSAVEGATEQLAYTVIKAPYPGILTKRHVELGEAVQAGQPLVSGLSLNELRVQVELPQSAIAAVRRYGRASVILDGPETRQVESTGITVFPYADPATHTFKVRVDLPQADSGLYPGMTVKTRFVVGERSAIWLPVSALEQRGELVGVFVLDDERPVLRQVRTGERLGQQVEILSGVAAGERIALRAADAVTQAGAR